MFITWKSYEDGDVDLEIHSEENDADHLDAFLTVLQDRDVENSGVVEEDGETILSVRFKRPA